MDIERRSFLRLCARWMAALFAFVQLRPERTLCPVVPVEEREWVIVRNAQWLPGCEPIEACKIVDYTVCDGKLPPFDDDDFDLCCGVPVC